MDPVDFDNATEEQMRYASTPIGAYVIGAIMLLGLVLSMWS